MSPTKKAQLFAEYLFVSIASDSSAYDSVAIAAWAAWGRTNASI